MQIFTPPPPPVVDISKYIDHGPFYNLFGAKWLAVMKSIDPDTTAFVARLGASHWVDLGNPLVSQGIDRIIADTSTGVTTADKDYILNYKVKPEEQFVLKKMYFS